MNKYKTMKKFTVHTLICTTVLLVLFLVSAWLTMISLLTLFILGAIVAHLVLIFIYYKKGFSLFALPLSHVIFIVPATALIWISYLLADLFSADYGFVLWFAILMVMGWLFYLLPVALVTLMISIVLKINYYNGAIQRKRDVAENPSRCSG